MRSPWLVLTLTVMFALSATLHGIRPMISYRAVDLGASTAQLGIVAASFAVLSVVVAMPAGRWADRWGEARLLVYGPILTALATLWCVVVDQIWQLALAHAFFGVGHIVTAIGAQTLIANRLHGTERDTRYGTLAMFVSMGQIVGPAAAGAGAAAAGASAVFASGTAVMVLATGVGVILWGWYGRAAGSSRNPASPAPSLLASGREIVRRPSMPHALFVSLAVLGCIDILIFYLPAYGEAHGISVATVGLLLAANGAAAMVSRLAMGWFLRRYGRRRFLTVSLALAAVAMAAVPFSGNVPNLYVLVIVIGFGLGVGQPLTIAWIAASAPAELRGTALGLRHSANRFGQLTVPLLAGVLAGATGLAAIFLSAAGLLASSSLLASRTDRS